MHFDFIPVLEQWPIILHGLWLTFLITVLSTFFGMILGIACGWARTEAPNWLKTIVTIYIETIRNTPFIIQLFFIFFGLPAIGIRLTAEVGGVIAMILNLGAYVSEIVRAGLESTSKGQIEAALSLALNKWQIFTRVILPPALARVWPALVGQVIIIMLGSSVCSQISVEELSFAANMIASNNFRNFESYIVITLIYLTFAILIRYFLNWLGPRFIFGRKIG